MVRLGEENLSGDRRMGMRSQEWEGRGDRGGLGAAN